MTVLEPEALGATNEPVHVVDIVGSSEVATHDRGPAIESTAVTGSSLTSPVLVTVAVTVSVSPSATFGCGALSTLIPGFCCGIDSVSVSLTVPS